MIITGPDLTKAPPRSPRVRLGGYVILPRLLDKGRATIAGKNGVYQFSSPLDRRFFGFTGIRPNSLMNQLATGKSDELILHWVRKSAPQTRVGRRLNHGLSQKCGGRLRTSSRESSLLRFKNASRPAGTILSLGSTFWTWMTTFLFEGKYNAMQIHKSGSGLVFLSRRVVLREQT